jgi:hypothetical protein
MTGANANPLTPLGRGFVLLRITGTCKEAES